MLMYTCTSNTCTANRYSRTTACTAVHTYTALRSPYNSTCITLFYMCGTHYMGTIMIEKKKMAVFLASNSLEAKITGDRPLPGTWYSKVLYVLPGKHVFTSTQI